MKRANVPASIRLGLTITSIATALVTAGAALSQPSTASAATPSRTAFSFSNPGVTDCGAFDDEYTDFFDAHLTVFYDAGGNPTRVVIHGTPLERRQLRNRANSARARRFHRDDRPARRDRHHRWKRGNHESSRQRSRRSGRGQGRLRRRRQPGLLRRRPSAQRGPPRRPGAMRSTGISGKTIGSSRWSSYSPPPPRC